jgi:hypothetical protein
MELTTAYFPSAIEALPVHVRKAIILNAFLTLDNPTHFLAILPTL